MAVLGFADEGPTTFRLKATATFLVDGVERTGSSVQEYGLEWNYQPQIGNNGAWRLLVKGEGIRVDVPNAEPIYVQLASGTVFNNCAVRSQGQDELRKSLLGIEHCDVDFYPTAIRFAGESHSSVLAVHAARQDRNGYRFVSMTFDRTEDPITEGNIPSDMPTDPKGLIYLKYDGLTDIMSLLSFESEDFR